MPSPTAVDRLAARIGEALGSEVELERPKDPAHGDFATNVAMRSARAVERPPRELAQEFAEQIAALPEVASAEVAGPGFINLRVADAFFLAALDEIGPGYGGGFADPAERVQVEMVSANPTGPIVVSAARNGAYGDCVARLLEFAGHEVAREYYYNDAGAQMDRFRASIAALRRGEPVPEDGYQGAYVEELARAEGDPVPKMLASIEHTMERFRIHFDSWALQSELEQRLARAAAEARHLREGRRALGAFVGLRRRAGLGADPLGRQGRHADVSGRRRRLPRRQAGARLRPRDLRARRRPPRDRALVRGDRPHARARSRPGRGAALPVRASDARRRVDEGLEARRQRRLPRRRDGRDRGRRDALVPRQPRPRPDDRDRPRPRRREVPEEPGLLRAVRARAHRGDPAQRRGGRDRRAAARPAGRARRRS